MITLDWTILASGIIFLITLWALNSLLFKPLFRVLDERENKTSKLRDAAAHQLGFKDALVEEYSAKIRQQKQEGYQLAEAARKEALSRRQEKISQARDEAHGFISEARMRIEQEVENVRQELKTEAKKMARTVTAQILKEN